MTEASVVESSALTRFLRTATRVAADLVLPPTCLSCRKPVHQSGGLCGSCWTGMGFIERPYCERLGTPFVSDEGGALVSPAAIAYPPAYDRARAVARYGDVARELVHLLKYGDRLDLARPLTVDGTRRRGASLRCSRARAGAIALVAALATALQSIGDARANDRRRGARAGRGSHPRALACDAPTIWACPFRAGAECSRRV